MKYKLIFGKLKFWSVSLASTIIFSSYKIWAQMPSIQVPITEEPDASEDFTWWYAALFMLALGLIGTILWRNNAKKAAMIRSRKPAKQKASKQMNAGNSLDAVKEMEWFIKNQKLTGKNVKNKSANSNRESLPQNKAHSNGSSSNKEDLNAEAGEKSSTELPIFSFQTIAPIKPFAPLPISSDEALMSAIEQTHEEFEEDEEIRELSVRVLRAFKTRNSVEALSQVALYDLSSNLRSKAVTVLSEFDHESVFETILLACADPSREVKAAAARALFRLSIDRADAWTRIAGSEEEGRIKQIARAAIEADLVGRSLDRLIHPDDKIALEAAAFTALIIKSGETDEVFDVLIKHKDINMRKAVLHVIKITKDQEALEKLYSLLKQNNLPLELREEVDKTIEEIGFATV